jgi:hypothetical protein
MNEWLRAIAEPMIPVEFHLKLSFFEMGCLLPIAIICGLCILAIAAWVLAVARYAASHSNYA